MNFLIANKLWLIVIGGLIGVMLGLWSEIYSLKGGIKDAKDEIKETQNELALKEAIGAVIKANLEACNTKIELQNAKFKELEIKKPDVKKIQEKAKSKFDGIKPLVTQSCEEKLERCERIFDELAR
nr:MAG TPA: Lipopolysaccharide assembly protein A domain [Siphoviridae sp. ctUxW2]